MASLLETIRIDVASSTVTYVGTAAVGSSESAPVWRIKKLISTPSGNLTILYVDGNTEVDSVWSDRATYNYS
jgi:hypothetical protein